ncbi:MAG: FHA domain-containing protein [Thermoanaerobaculia bacterium]
MSAENHSGSSTVASPLPSRRTHQTSSPPESATCFLQYYSRFFPLREGENVVGRDPACAAVIDEPDVSRDHARIAIAGHSATIEDLGSKNGTLVDGVRIREKTALSPGSEIRLGETVLSFRRRDALQSTKSASFGKRQ